MVSGQPPVHVDGHVFAACRRPPLYFWERQKHYIMDEVQGQGGDPVIRLNSGVPEHASCQGWFSPFWNRRLQGE